MRELTMQELGLVSGGDHCAGLQARQQKAADKSAQFAEDGKSRQASRRGDKADALADKLAECQGPLVR